MASNRLSEIFKLLFPWIIQEQQQAKKLALKAEASVRQLSKLPSADSQNRDLISILNQICLLLERFREYPELLHPSEQQPIEEPTTTLNNVEPPLPFEPSPAFVPEPEPQLSATAKELIKLRDWILLAKSGEGDITPDLLEVLYHQLGKILEAEEVTTLEEMGLFNYERHQVISTKPTDDPNQKDCICDTVRPGYLFHGSLIRPQEVIVYT